MATVPSSDRFTRSVPGKRPVSLGRSAPRQRVGTNGYRPRTRNEPPGGGVSRRKLAAGPAGSSGVEEGLGLAAEADGVSVPSVELGRSFGDYAVQATTKRSSATVARTLTWPPLLLRSRRIILTTLTGRVVLWPRRDRISAKV